MMNSLILLLVALFSLPTQAGVTKDQIDCKTVELNFKRTMAGFKTKCSKHEECRVDYFDWNACQAVAHSESESLAKEMKSNRDGLHKLCEVPAVMCPAVMAEVKCVNRKCQLMNGNTSKSNATKSDLKSTSINFLFKLKGAPYANQKVIISADTGIRCVTVPCPSRANVHSFKTDAEGRASLTIGFLQNLSEKPAKLGSSPVGPDGMAFITPNEGFVPFSLKNLLLDTQKTYEINF